MQVNENFKNLSQSYLFYTIAKKTEEFKKSNPSADVIRMGIGDVTLPLCLAVTEAMQKAVNEMADESTFKGYPPAQGYEFLRNAISDYYKNRGTEINKDEIYISDGAKSDTANILDIFGSGITALIPDPVYPVYHDTNIMAGNKIIFAGGHKNNNFLPMPDENTQPDLIYICSPNNPTGAVYSHEQLKNWVDFALKNDAVILFDAAYEGFVGKNYPKSIFEIEGSRACAIEFGSFSKSAGMTGVRCAYTIVPSELERCGQNLGKMWLRRVSAKFNGVSYVTQKGAEAALSKKGLEQTEKSINYYKDNAKIISETLKSMGIWHTGGKHSPYIWLNCPNNMDDWNFFDLLLKKINVVGTPGSGFGKNGKNFFRFSSFGNKEKIIEAMERFRNLKF